MRLDALRSGEPGVLHQDAALLEAVGDEDLEAARLAVLGRGGLLAATGQGAAVSMDGADTVVPDPTARLGAPRDLAGSPSLALLAGLVPRRTAPRAEPA